MTKSQSLIGLIAALALAAGSLALSCLVVDGNEDDDEDCIICYTTAECTEALGEGWGCVDDCCQFIADDDPDDYDQDDEDDDSDDDDDAAEDDD